MPIYWTLRAIPELAPLSRKERGRIWRLSYPKAYRHWQAWLGIAFAGICGGTGVSIGAAHGFSQVGAFLGGGIGGVICGQILMHMILPYIRQAAAEQQGVAGQKRGG